MGRTLRGLQLGRRPCSILVRVTLVLTSGTMAGGAGRVFSGPGTQGPTDIPNNSEGFQAPAGLHLQPPGRGPVTPRTHPRARLESHLLWAGDAGHGPLKEPMPDPTRPCSLLRKEGQDPSSSPEAEGQQTQQDGQLPLGKAGGSIPCR